MNWKRVTLFVAILFAATFAAAFPLGMVQGFFAAQQKPVPAWLPLGQALAAVATQAVVFFALARRQSDRPWHHAFAVAAIAWLISFPINVLGFGQVVSQWAFGIIGILVGVVAGVGFASRQQPTAEPGRPY